MEEKKIIIRIAKLKQSLRSSMVKHLSSEVVQQIEHAAIERRVDRWFTELHRRELNRRATLKGLILPGNRVLKRPVPSVQDVVETKEVEPVENVQKPAQTTESTEKNDKTNLLIQELFAEEESSKEVQQPVVEEATEVIEEPQDVQSKEVDEQQVVAESSIDESIEIVKENDDETSLVEDIGDEDAIPLVVPQRPRRRATQKKMFRSRTAPKIDERKDEDAPEQEATSSQEVGTEEEPESERLKVSTAMGSETFSVIQDPELQLIPSPKPLEEPQKEPTIEELCDALDEDPLNIEKRMMRAAQYEKEKKLVFALSDYRKAAEQHHDPAWDAYIRVLLQCNLKARAAEAEARRERG